MPSAFASSATLSMSLFTSMAALSEVLSTVQPLSLSHLQVVIRAKDITEFKEVLGQDEYNTFNKEISKAFDDLNQTLLSGRPTNYKDIFA